MNGYTAFPRKSEASPSDCLVLYAGHSLRGGGSYFSAEMQSMYSAAPADWTSKDFFKGKYEKIIRRRDAQ